MDYKDTLNLPSTGLPMKANLKVKEANTLLRWEDMDLYSKIRIKSKGGHPYILHDGPPYANGNIHLGTALNKILKDFIVRIKTMEGFDAPFVPGWDCHGLPIELQVEKELGKTKREKSKTEIRKLCRSYAERYVSIQREEFKRLGVLADWDNPYLTMNYSYEAVIVRELGKFIANGGLYKGLKPIHWCISCRTALAEAEVEYHNHRSPSIYVKFLLDREKCGDLFENHDLPVSIVIWTTTPWTLLANLAVCVNPSFEYSIINTEMDGFMIIASSLLSSVTDACGIKNYTLMKELSGEKLEGLNYLQPLTGQKCPVILGDHVTLEQGTGSVHTAPGHGEDDYKVGQRYGLPVYNPVDDFGKFVDGVDDFSGMKVFDANIPIIEKLKKLGLLLKTEQIEHSYPHCWRCRKPVIFRATSQWFISMEKNRLRDLAMKEIESKEWIPSWGKERIYNMVQNRPDWCVSRQRVWGVPIIAVYCMDCNKEQVSEKLIEHVALMVEREGADIWFEKDIADLVPCNMVCASCGGQNFKRETDILDVWFDSGVSHTAVMEKHKDLSWPADIYLEGSDQHRGWFHSSLLEAVGTRGTAPYRTVLTHGYVVDGKGKKMSKSAGNVISPQKIIDRYGAEILRLWVASENYREDIRISEEILKRLTEAYRKIRNTLRFMLGNLSDFDYKNDRVNYGDLFEIDKYMLHTLQMLVQRVRDGYSRYEYHIFYHSIQNYCTVSLSSFYLDIIKDRLYTFKRGSKGRRSAQTAVFEITDTILRLAAPILSFTTEEIWSYLYPKHNKGVESIHLTSIPDVKEEYVDEEINNRWEGLKKVRGEVSKALETARREKIIGHSLDAHVELFAGTEWQERLLPYKDELKFIFIVSQTTLRDMPFSGKNGVYKSETIPELTINITTAEGKKCERCWNYCTTVGLDNTHKAVCHRCIINIKS